MANGRIVAVGHVILRTKDVHRLVDFYKKTVGLKHVVKGDYFNAFEAGDVHFCIMPGDPGEAPFDFTTDDVNAFRERLVKADVPCTDVSYDERSGHHSFNMTDPDGHKIRINSAHEPMPEVE